MWRRTGLLGLALLGASCRAPTEIDDVQESFRFGNRFVLWGLQEISAAVSLDVIHDFDERGRLAPNTKLTVGLDFTVNWVF